MTLTMGMALPVSFLCRTQLWESGREKSGGPQTVSVLWSDPEIPPQGHLLRGVRGQVQGCNLFFRGA